MSRKTDAPSAETPPSVDTEQSTPPSVDTEQSTPSAVVTITEPGPMHITITETDGAAVVTYEDAPLGDR
jgi:hypothetical protein